MGEEVAQFGWKKLAELVGKSPRSCMRRKKPLQEAGAILYTLKMNNYGRKYRAMFFFPSIVKAYIIRNSSGEGKLF